MYKQQESGQSWPGHQAWSICSGCGLCTCLGDWQLHAYFTGVRGHAPARIDSTMFSIEWGQCTHAPIADTIVQLR